MALISLPENPSLDRLRAQARQLQRAVRSGDPEATALVIRHIAALDDPGTFPLSAAQFAVARSYGFASWPRLKRYLDVIVEHRWSATPPADAESETVADQFCRLACLTYTRADGPERWRQAGRLLAEHPEITASS